MVANVCFWAFFWIAFFKAARPYLPAQPHGPVDLYCIWGRAIGLTTSSFLYPFMKVAFVIEFPSFLLITMIQNLFFSRLSSDYFVGGISVGGFKLLAIMAVSFVQWYLLGRIAQRTFVRGLAARIFRRSRVTGFRAGIDVTQKFTGKERDAESQLDYFGARYYGSALGRFTSPDWSAKPEAVPYVNLEDPQTLNLYGYVRNNPLSKADIDGHIFGADDAIEGGALVVVGFGLAVSAYIAQPENQKSLGAALNTAVNKIGSALDNIFHSTGNTPPPPSSTTQGNGQPSTPPTTGTATNTNPYAGPVSGPVTVVDPKGNAIPVNTGE